MPKAYSGTANSTASACIHVAQKCATFVGESASRSGSKGGSPRADSSSQTLMPHSCRRPGGGTKRCAVERASTEAPGERENHLRPVALDLRSCRCKDVPAGAEVVQVLPGRLSRLRVLHEPVEGVTGVGHLRRPVGAARGSEQRLLRCACGGRLASGEERRPVGRAGSGAGTVSAFVILEQVERPAAAVGEDAAELRGRARN